MFKKGDPRPAGAGMQKGQATRRSFAAQEIFHKHNFDPLDAVIERLKTNGKTMDEKLFIESCLKVAKFKYSELKSIDHTINPKDLSDKELLEETARLVNELKEHV